MKRKTLRGSTRVRGTTALSDTPVTIASTSLTALLVSALCVPSTVQAQTQSHTQLPEIRVTATATRLLEAGAESPQDSEVLAITPVTIIDRATLERSTQLSDVLRQTGLGITQNGGFGQASGLFIRGLNNGRILVLLDGVPLNNNSDGGVSLGEIQPQQLERVEIVRGNLSALYGANAVGGVIQLFSRTTGNSLSVGGGDWGTMTNNLTLNQQLNDAVRLHLGVGQFDSRSISATNPRNAFSYNPDRDGFQNRNYRLGVTVDVSQQQQIRLNGFQRDSTVQFDNGQTQTHDTNVQFEWTSRWTTQLRSQLQLQQLDTQRNTQADYGDSAVVGKTQRLVWQHEYSTDLWRGIGTQNWLAGYERQLQSASSDYDPKQPSRRNTSEFVGWNAAVQRWSVALNGRYDDYANQDTVPTGSAQVQYAITPTMAVFAKRSTAFRTPTFDDLYAVYGGYAKPNPLLKPEYSRGTELGFKHHYTVRDWQLQHTFTLFDQDIHNKITYVTDPTTYVGQSVNREHVTVRGAEWLSEASLKSWRMGANLSYQEVVDQATQRRETRQPYVLGSVWVGYHQEQWHTQMTLSGQGARYDGTKPLAGYGTLDVQAGYRLNATTQLGVRVNNALNRQYETAYGYNSLPRLAMATLTYHF